MKGIITLWADTLASIPENWLLCDGNNSTPNLLGKYLLSVGTSEDPGTTGGSATHTHTSPEHTHIQDSHNHTGTTGTVSGSQAGRLNVSSNVTEGNHTHTYTTNSTVAINQTSTDAVDTASNDPVYYKVAPIIDNSTIGVKYPIGSLIFWGQTISPNGWSICDGNNGTPDLRNKFLKCVESAENPGTIGGSATHLHTTTHTHVQNSHIHTGTTGYGGNCSSLGGAYAPLLVRCDHTHSITVNNTVSINQNSSDSTDSINGEPIFKKLFIIKNIGIANRPKYAIVVWTGTISNIPLGYILCDGNNGTPNLLNYFVKGAYDSTEIEGIGGSSIHNHSASSHNHIQNLHVHSVVGDLTSGSYGSSGYAGGFTCAHSHATLDSTPTTATNQSTTMTINNCSSQANYPTYYKVAYVMQDRDLDLTGANLMQMLL